MELLIAILGLAFLAVLIYYAVTGAALPEGLRLVLLIAVALVLIFCILQQTNCAPFPMPHR